MRNLGEMTIRKTHPRLILTLNECKSHDDRLIIMKTENEFIYENNDDFHLNTTSFILLSIKFVNHSLSKQSFTWPLN